MNRESRGAVAPALAAAGAGTWSYEGAIDRFYADEPARRILGLEDAPDRVSGVDLLARFEAVYAAALRALLDEGAPGAVAAKLRGSDHFVTLRGGACDGADPATRVGGIVLEERGALPPEALQADARASEARFRMLAEGVPNQLVFLDRDLRIEFANDVFLQASGWSAEAARGRHISEIMEPERYLERRQYYERALSGETVAYEAVGAAGSKSGYFRFSYRPSFDDDGGIRGMFTMATDISERRRIELELEAKQEELVRSNRDLEQFAYVASHDLKAPLRSVELLVQWIKEALEEYEDEDVHENLGLLERRTKRLGRLLDDLLAYSRAGRKIGEYGCTDCRDLVEDAIGLVNPPAGIAVEIEGVLPSFETYAVPLGQVLRNLVGNAIKHHPGPTGKISISCQEHEDHYLFSVADDGAGIAPEYAERVFEMFQTLKPRDRMEGSGMGLAIVNRIVAWQGGRVWFESGAGGGTIFRFQWMKKQRAAPALEAAI